ncbi:MAG: glycogen debranching enzyme N-terminal domain-containing protein [Acidobacteriota bacterium]|nr:glycogen debranching enzyme N-terminal domain-containing protein [Acidobacteriota bacterium]
MLAVIHFNEEECQDLQRSLSREWLETNGIGGFASATVAGANTRRYHGLLTAALHPPVGRYVLLSKLEETVFLNGERYELSCNIYPGTTHPEGFRYLKSFRLDPFPIFTFEVGGVRIEKRVFMVHGENTTVVEYEASTGAGCTIEVRPLIAFRDYHSTTHANPAIDGHYAEPEGGIVLHPYRDLPDLHLAHNARWVGHEGNWYYRFEYPRERERGLDCEEDLFQPLVMQFDAAEGRPAVVIASTQAHSAASAEHLRAAEIARRGALSDHPDSFAGALTVAADQFIVKRAGNLHTVIAGYHWFSDWGRDTMIALPGLTLATKRFDIARDILLAFSQAVDMGMLPNRFPDVGETPEYNTVDASLWYFEAIRKFLDYTGDLAFVKDKLYATMKSIVECHIEGTRYGIHCGPDGLIQAGTPETQLTWMDAKIGDFVATPRSGKPVEIQALWYNALCVTESLAETFGDTAFQKTLRRTANLALASFNEQFWNEDLRCLYDVVDGERKDAAIRPNQAIALSLGYSMLSPARAESILDVIEEELLTEFGLRTLNASDPQYQTCCDGDQVKRDSAYHQGTVWPWLLGPFITAYIRTYPDRKAKARGWLNGLERHLREAGLGSISEIFDAAEPHTPRGCIAQAWSVSELLRVLVEDLKVSDRTAPDALAASQ